MKLNEFIDETLSEILTGIRSAQAKEGGGEVAASLQFSSERGVVHGGDYGNFTIVEFDVGVTVDTAAGAKGGIRVFSALELGSEGTRSWQQENRVKFSVPVRLPEGDRSRQEALDEQEKQRADRLYGAKREADERRRRGII